MSNSPRPHRRSSPRWSQLIRKAPYGPFVAEVGPLCALDPGVYIFDQLFTACAKAGAPITDFADTVVARQR
jgi:hypothetical protein